MTSLKCDGRISLVPGTSVIFGVIARNARVYNNVKIQSWNPAKSERINRQLLEFCIKVPLSRESRILMVLLVNYNESAQRVHAKSRESLESASIISCIYIYASDASSPRPPPDAIISVIMPGTSSSFYTHTRIIISLAPLDYVYIYMWSIL